MSEFLDVYLPASIPGYPATISPVTSTTITVVSSGDEDRNRNWRHPLRKVKLPAAQARDWQCISDLIDHFLVLGGPETAFAFRDPMDFATVRLKAPNEPTAGAGAVLSRITGADQQFGVGDGFTRTFQLTKAYVRGAGSYVRKIQLPVLSSVVILDAGGAPGSYAISRPGGVVTFDLAPAAGHALTWGGLFDIPIRFDADTSLDAIVAAWQVGGAAEIDFQETRVC